MHIYLCLLGAAEKVRLALVLQNIPFEDERIQMSEWPALKAKTKYGQLPLMVLNWDEENPIAQSNAMLRYVVSFSGGKLYPQSKLLEIEELLGLSDDIARVGIHPLISNAMYMRIANYYVSLYSLLGIHACIIHGMES
jgi:glutathione S-transferase